MLVENASCPGSYFQCNSSDSEHGYGIGASPYLAIPSVISSTLSCIGSVIIVYTYCRWKDIRTGSRAIITFLSIADFFTAIGYIVGSLNYAISYSSSRCVAFTYMCQIQSFVTSTSSLSSFFWTLSLAVYLYLSLVHNRVNLVQKLLPLFHLINWGFPLLVVLPLLIAGVLGYSYMAVSTWCFIGGNVSYTESILFVMIGGKIWEILTYIFVIIFYILIKRHISVQAKKCISNKSLNAGLIAMLRKSDKKLIAIPVVFVLLRCWGTFHFFFSLIVHHDIRNGCTTATLRAVFTFLSVMQAIGDGGQGWGNLILYVIVSDRIRNKLLGCCRRDSDKGLNHLEDRSSVTDKERVGHAINYGTTEDTKPLTKKKGQDVETLEPTTA